VMLVPRRHTAYMTTAAMMVAVIAATGGCDWRSLRRLPTEHAPIMLALGDSITFGTSADKAMHYPALVEDMFAAEGIDVRFYNAGFPGDVCQRAKTRAVKLLEFHPIMMVIALGTNDITGKTLPSEAEHSLAQAIEAMQAENVAVFLIGSQVQRRSAERLQAFADMYHRLAARYEVPLILDILAPVSNNPDLIREDNIHPTEAGQVAIAEMLYQPLKAAFLDASARRQKRQADAGQN
jgi:acyl-CoA thioesterase-1